MIDQKLLYSAFVHEIVLWWFYFGFTHVNEANARMSYGSVFVELLLMIRLSAST